MNAPPPMPEDCGSTTLSTSWTAIAASTALPPRASVAMPASTAAGCAATTIACLLVTSALEVQPDARSWAPAGAHAAAQTSIAARTAANRTGVKRMRADALVWSQAHSTAPHVKRGLARRCAVAACLRACAARGSAKCRRAAPRHSPLRGSVAQRRSGESYERCRDRSSTRRQQRRAADRGDVARSHRGRVGLVVPAAAHRSAAARSRHCVPGRAPRRDARRLRHHELRRRACTPGASGRTPRAAPTRRGSSPRRVAQSKAR